MANSNKGGGFFEERAMSFVASYYVGTGDVKAAVEEAKAKHPGCVVRARASNGGTRQRYVARYTVYVYQRKG